MGSSLAHCSTKSTPLPALTELGHDLAGVVLDRGLDAGHLPRRECRMDELADQRVPRRIHRQE